MKSISISSKEWGLEDLTCVAMLLMSLEPDNLSALLPDSVSSTGKLVKLYINLDLILVKKINSVKSINLIVVYPVRNRTLRIYILHILKLLDVHRKHSNMKVTTI